MGIVHVATLTPTKQELVEAWLPSRSWGVPITGKVGEYRFDDPAGEVGVETILWSTEDGRVVQTPLTYRAEPLPGADAHLVGTCDHSVLGERWVYDGCADPVWASTLATVVLTGGTHVQMFFEQDGQRVDIPPRVEVRGSGSADVDVPAVTTVDDVHDDGAVTTATAGGLRLHVARVLGTDLPGEQTLTGHVVGSDDTHLFASVERA